jgi:hypothetical protein
VQRTQFQAADRPDPARHWNVYLKVLLARSGSINTNLQFSNFLHLLSFIHHV